MHTGRPETPIDWDKVGNYIKQGFPGSEIAQAFGLTGDSLYRRCEEKYGVNYSTFALKHKLKGDIEIYNAQYDEAVNKRDKTLLIWLGKSRLGQCEKTIHEHTAKITTQQIVRELDTTIPRNSLDGRPEVETGTSILDQRRTREEDTMFSELGTAGLIGESAPVLSSAEGETARDNNVFLPIPPRQSIVDTES